MKLIVVDGPKSSGKTGAIKLASKLLGVDFSSSPVADIRCVTLIRVGTTNRFLGIGSAGDDAAAIRANLDFFKCHELDFAICASSAPKVGRPLVDAFALLVQADLEEIKTRTVDTKAIQAECEAVACRITRAIRGY